MKLLRPLYHALSPTCKEAVRLQSEAVRRRLSPFEHFGLRVHLKLCKWCRRYERELTLLRSVARQCGDNPAPGQTHELTTAARERIRGSIQSDRCEATGCKVRFTGATHR
jgi:hypothetical protein